MVVPSATTSDRQKGGANDHYSLLPFDSTQERHSRIPCVGVPAIAGNLLTDQEVEMLERESRPPERCRAYIMGSIKRPLNQ